MVLANWDAAFGWTKNAKGHSIHLLLGLGAVLCGVPSMGSEAASGPFDRRRAGR